MDGSPFINFTSGQIKTTLGLFNVVHVSRDSCLQGFWLHVILVGSKNTSWTAFFWICIYLLSLICMAQLIF